MVKITIEHGDTKKEITGEMLFGGVITTTNEEPGKIVGVNGFLHGKASDRELTHALAAVVFTNIIEAKKDRVEDALDLLADFDHDFSEMASKYVRENLDKALDHAGAMLAEILKSLKV